MKKEEMELDQKTLTAILNEHVGELKDIKDFVKQLGQRLDQKDKSLTEKQNEVVKLIASFENKYKKMEVIAPKMDMAPISLTMASGVLIIKKAVTDEIGQLFAKNRIMVLPEDGGKGLAKLLGKRFAIMVSAIVILSFFGWLGLRYWYLNSKNSTYRKAWYWSYMHRDSTGKKYMMGQLDSFKISDINKARTDTIEAYERDIEKEKQVKALESEADSLKTK